MNPSAAFAGARAQTGPLTWGQLGVWKAIEDLQPDDHRLNMPAVLDPPRRRAVDVASAAAAVAGLVERHDALRTRIRRSGGDLVQVVAGAGRIPIEVARMTVTGPTGRAQAAALADRLAATPFDYARDWPLRVGFIVDGDAVRHIVLVLSHTAADLYAVDLVVRDLRLLLLRGSVPAPAHPQPLDLAELQRHTGRQRTDAALAYWTAQYARLPGTALPYRPAAELPAGPRYCYALLTSPALAVAARTVADRVHVGSGTVLLAAAFELLGRYTGQDVVGMLTIVGNRHQAEHRDVVSSMSQLALMVVDLSDRPTFDRLVARTRQEALRAYRHSYYDQAALDAAVEKLGRSHGTRLDPESCFNDIHLAADVPPARETDPGRTELAWETWDRINWRWYLEVRDAPGGLCLALGADTRCLPVPEMERFVRDLEHRVVAAAAR